MPPAARCQSGDVRVRAPGVPRRAWFATLGTAAAVAAVAGACAPADVRWEPERRVSAAFVPGAQLVFGNRGAPAVRPPAAPTRWPGDSTACPAARAAVPAGGDTVIAAWWEPGMSRRNVLRLSRSPNGGIDWERAIEVGVSAPGRAPCDQPPPGVAVADGSRAVVVAYHGAVGNAAGIVLASVPPGARRTAGLRIAAPGETPRLADVGISGDTVAVAYESPAVADGAVWLAIWVGPGQIPLVRERVSGANARAYGPLVALHAGRIVVGWNEAARGGNGPAAVVRVGRVGR